MKIKQLLKTSAEYQSFALDLFEYKLKDKVIWRPADMPKLQAFFDWESGSNKNKKDSPWTPEIKESFEFVKKCKEEYADRMFEIKHALEQIPVDNLTDSLYFKERFTDLEQFEMEEKYPDDWEKRMDDAGSDYVFDEKEFPYKFPVIVIGSVDSGFDRTGNCAVLDLHIVSKSDFE